MAPSLVRERAMLAENPGVLVAIDEVGRGALAGPVTIGAVALTVDAGEPPDGVDDSKKLNASRREGLVAPIRSWTLASAVVHIPASRIDDVGLSRCLGEGARDAIASIEADVGQRIACVLLDGKHDFLSPVQPGYRIQMVTGGDRECASIAAASILAKVERDRLMKDLHDRHRVYGWDRNVGYGTAEHRRAILSNGPSDQHRRSWNL